MRSIPIRSSDLWDFVTDLRQPNEAFLRTARAPLIERNPLLFWKALSLVLALTVLALLAAHVLR